MAGQVWNLYEVVSPVFALTDTVLFDDKSQAADEDRIQAVTIAKLLAYLHGGLQPNIETLAGTKTLADTDVPVQSYDANGSNRDVRLPAEGSANHIFYVINSGATGNLVVKDDSGVTTYVTIEPGQMSIVVSDGATWAAVAGGGGGGGTDTFSRAAEGRLTLTSGLPVTTADVTGATTLYYTPYVGNQIALYDGADWALHTFTERSIAIPASTNTNYDVFIYDNAGTITLELVAWTNATTRATALTYQDGVLVKSGATGRRYLGTVRTTGVSGQTEDSKAKRFVWNYYNRVNRFLSAVDTTDSWTYTTATFRQANASAANQVEAVIGVAEDVVWMHVVATSNNAGAVARGSGVGIDSTNTNSAQTIGGVEQAGGKANTEANYLGIPAAGYHYYAWLEISQASGTTTWLGDNGLTYMQSGITGLIQG